MPKANSPSSMLLDSNPTAAFLRLQSSPKGISVTEAASRLANSQSATSTHTRDTDLRLLLRQFKSPLVLLLLVAMSISATLGDRLDAIIVFAVIAMSTLMGFWQERRAAHTLAALLKVIQTHTSVLRDDVVVDVPSDQIVAGDVVVLNAGDAIPGDGLILDAKDLFVDESVLTGESYPAEKEAFSATSNNASESTKSNFVYEGTHDLSVIADGVRTGRNTFANSMKYIFITTSANFGNMFSMAGASLFMPFLPLLPKQILLNNFLSDLPALTIATDAVDPEQVLSPRQWDNRTIRRFMVTFGLVSSLFDLLTFGTLLVFLKASEAQFQTGWFIESLLTELLIILVIRTRRSLFRSRPSRLLALAIIAVTVVAILIPYTSIGAYFGLIPLPWWWLATLVAISCSYIATSELLKTILFPPLFARRGSHG